MANILVVDDDSNFRGIMKRVIHRLCSCSVKCAMSESEAWDRLSEELYDLVLLDLHIEGKKSWETLKKIGRLPSAPPVILVTCDDTKENAEFAKSLGAKDFLSKPIDFGRLKTSIDSVLRSK